MMRRRFGIGVLAILALSCGRPTLVDDRRTVTVVSSESVDGKPERMRIVVTRSDCPTEQWALSGSVNSCLKTLTADRPIELVLQHYRFPVMSCGKPAQQSKRMIGDCDLSGISVEQLSICKQ